MMQALLEKLLQWDYEMWFCINQQWRNGFLDGLMPFLRNQFTWAPLYVFLLFFSLINYGKKGLAWVGFFLIAFGIADYLSASIIKAIVHRPRPFQDRTGTRL